MPDDWWDMPGTYFPKVTLLNELFNLFLELVIVLHVVTYDLMIFTPFVGRMPHNVRLRGCHKRIIVVTKDFTPCLFMTSVQGAWSSP